MRNNLFIFAFLPAALFIAGCSALPGGGDAVKKNIKPVDDLFLVTKNLPGDVAAAGYMDKTGKVVINFSAGMDFEGKKYLANNKRKEPDNLLELAPFVGGYAAFCVRNRLTGTYSGGYDSRCGFLDKTGKIAVEPKYTQTGYFNDGLAAVAIDENGDSLGGTKWGFIDNSGKMAVPQRWEVVRDFSDGVVWVKEEIDSKFALIDKTGAQIIAPAYSEVSDFSEGMAVVRRTGGGDDKYFIIDKTGKELKELPPGIKFAQRTGRDSTHDQLHYRREDYYDWRREYPGEYDYSPVSEGILRGEGKDHSLVYLTPEGKPAFELKNPDIRDGGDFSEGYAYLRSTFPEKEQLISKFGGEAVEDLFTCSYVNKKGEVKNVPFANCGTFHEGLAAVYFVKDDLKGWGFINDKLENAIQPVFEDAGSFEGGLAWVKVKEGSQTYSVFSMSNWEGYVDTSGKPVVPQW
jgi:WG containing repeat